MSNNPQFPTGSVVEVKGPMCWKSGYEVIAGPNDKGVMKVRSLRHRRGRPPQPHQSNVRLAWEEAV